jgi:hypothetical protein
MLSPSKDKFTSYSIEYVQSHYIKFGWASQTKMVTIRPQTLMGEAKFVRPGDLARRNELGAHLEFGVTLRPIGTNSTTVIGSFWSKKLQFRASGPRVIHASRGAKQQPLRGP